MTAYNYGNPNNPNDSKLNDPDNYQPNGIPGPDDTVTGGGFGAGNLTVAT